jgi:hypothetical protein
MPLRVQGMVRRTRFVERSVLVPIKHEHDRCDTYAERDHYGNYSAHLLCRGHRIYSSLLAVDTMHYISHEVNELFDIANLRAIILS